MGRKITINPITRLEGHGKIEIFLDDKGDVENAYLQVPELRGFEKFCEGRPAEEMPRITPKICGVCPTAHLMASSKALDDLFKVEPPLAARKIRELMYSLFMLEDHALHFFFLGGPDFIVGPMQSAAQRNILGVIAKVGKGVVQEVIKLRRLSREIITLIGGKAPQPVCGLPGGVSKGLTEEDRVKIKESAKYILEFAQKILTIFNEIVLKNKVYLELIKGDTFIHKTYYMGLVNPDDKVDFYDGQIKIVDPEGKEFARFPCSDYLKYIAEHVEPWTYIKFPYLKEKGWQGFVDGKEGSVYRVAPLARLNVSSGFTTPLAQAEYERMYDILGEKPAHYTLAFHWARLVELLYAAENISRLADEPALTDTNIRNLPRATPVEGVGVVEAPRGTLIHHYQTDKKGILTAVNLIVATQNNITAICMSIKKAAQSLIKDNNTDEPILNTVEMAYRAYDPCLACGTHSLPGQMPLIVNIYNHKREIIKVLRRD